MRINGGLLSHSDSEWLQLREAWKKWNAKCHDEDQIDWEDYYDKHGKKYNKSLVKNKILLKLALYFSII